MGLFDVCTLVYTLFEYLDYLVFVTVKLTAEQVYIESLSPHYGR